jgi:hypothetical protein
MFMKFAEEITPFAYPESAEFLMSADNVMISQASPISELPRAIISPCAQLIQPGIFFA